MDQNIKILKTEILSDNWYTLKKVTYEYLKKDKTLQIQNREAYDRGNGATILLYNKEQRTVILTRQFRKSYRDAYRSMCWPVRQRQRGRLHQERNGGGNRI